MRRHPWTILTLFLLAAGLLAACGPTATPAPTPAPTQPGDDGVLHGEANVDEIGIQILESFPVQVHIVARGNLSDGCTEIDEVRQERTGQTFQVTITTIRPSGAVCTEALVPFEETIALEVLGLEAGTYTVDANGVTGTFELTVDNVPVGEPPSGGLSGGVLATFDVNGEAFRVWVTNPRTIQQLLGLASGAGAANIPNGRIQRGPGLADYNLPWSWHLDPEDIEMAEMTAEVCDGTPSYVEAHLDEFVDTVGRYCPWSARLVSVDVHDPPALPALTWHREGGIAGFCDDLSIDAAGMVDAASCAGDPSGTVAHGRLDDARLGQLQGWIETLRPFEVEQTDDAVADAMTIRLVFAGQGTAEPTDADRAAILEFAAEVYAAFSGG